MVTTLYPVAGMTCDHCAHAVASAIERLAHVVEVRVDLATGVATVSSEEALDRSAVETAVEQAGYTLGSG